MKQINEFQLRITGRASLDKKLELSHDYLIKANVNIISAKAKDTQENTLDMEYSAKLITAEIIDDKGEVIKVLDRKKKSQSLRGAIYYYQQDINNAEDEEAFYNKVMDYLIAHLPELLRGL